MVKTLIPAMLMIAALSSCSSLKPLGSANNNSNVNSPRTTNTTTTKTTGQNKEVRFLEDISVTANPSVDKMEPSRSTAASKKEQKVETKNVSSYTSVSERSPSVEKATSLQLKYSILLNVEVELLTNNALLAHVDEWYGTPYRMGGLTKSGIDCSAFVQAVYLSAFAVSLPRTARDQFKTARIVSTTELKEGDLVFFNTRGGVSHVGIYLQNNKFIHASTSYGVTVSDMFDPYYLKRFVGAGRIEKPEAKNTGL
jgi:cell wall-associated NlpC family hydrolase